MKPFKTLLLAGIAVLALSAPAAASDGHGDHAGHAHEAADAAGGGHGHDEGHGHAAPHFTIETPATTDAAWAMIDETIASAHQALKDSNADALHEAGEKIAAAITALQSQEQSADEAAPSKIGQALEQLEKTADRFHHAAEDKDTEGAAEALELFESQAALVKTLYPAAAQ